MKNYKSGANGLVIKFSLTELKVELKAELKVGSEVGSEVESKLDEFKGSESKLFMLKVIK